jgi:hypothetical protein
MSAEDISFVEGHNLDLYYSGVAKVYSYIHLLLIYLLDIAFNETEHIVHIKKMREISYKIMAITDVDKRASILQLCIHQEIFGLLWWIEIGLSSNTLNFLELTSLCCSLDILEVNPWTLTDSPKHM